MWCRKGHQQEWKAHGPAPTWTADMSDKNDNNDDPQGQEDVDE
jgi:hypothetical protein